jgi:hypothetical protein
MRRIVILAKLLGNLSHYGEYLWMPVILLQSFLHLTGLVYQTLFGLWLCKLRPGRISGCIGAVNFGLLRLRWRRRRVIGMGKSPRVLITAFRLYGIAIDLDVAPHLLPLLYLRS